MNKEADANDSTEGRADSGMPSLELLREVSVPPDPDGVGEFERIGVESSGIEPEKGKTVLLEGLIEILEALGELEEVLEGSITMLGELEEVLEASIRLLESITMLGDLEVLDGSIDGSIGILEVVEDSFKTLEILEGSIGTSIFSDRSVGISTSVDPVDNASNAVEDLFETCKKTKGLF